MVTFIVVYSVTGNLIPALSAMAGSIMPDVLELGGLIQHRTITHCIWVWLAISTFLWVCLGGTGFSSIPLYVTLFFVAGGLLHVVEDSLSYGGVPIFGPYGKKMGVGVYRTDTLGEEFTVLGLLLVFFGFSYKSGYLSADHITRQTTVFMNLLNGLSGR